MEGVVFGRQRFYIARNGSVLHLGNLIPVLNGAHFPFCLEIRIWGAEIAQDEGTITVANELAFVSESQSHVIGGLVSEFAGGIRVIIAAHFKVFYRTLPRQRP